ncbi:MAG TPA: thymidine phosphorylase [Pyrinomonadaceae bacterium]
MRPQDIIRKKRDGQVLTREEIAFFVKGLTEGSVADYQASALLMAIFLKGMDASEQRALTEEMLHSGTVLDFSSIDGPKVDKHSTGGVGDKTSLVIAPLVAAVGAYVPMISGRGLGHTGGTLDKLEAIPGYRVHLSLTEFRAVLERVGFAMMGQTEEIAPADRKLYALRDATATVEAIPLIVASIMSKKMAAGLGALVLDIKTGSGAFMETEELARRLAHALVATGEGCGVHTEALITDMNQPLGEAVGNALETRECLEILRGEASEGARPVLDLSVELAAHMVLASERAASLDEARALVRRALETGAALERFRANVEAQGGDPRLCDAPASLFDLKLHEVKVESARAGFITHIETAEIGHAVAALGGGRVRMEDRIDGAVGFIGRAKIGDEVKTGQVVGLVYGRRAAEAQTAARRIQAAYLVGDEPPSPGPTLIKEVITA